MKPEWSNGIVDIYRGNARGVLCSLEPESVHCVVTSPPYWGLRDYGIGEDALGLEPTPELYVEHVVEIFQEVKRVLKKDGTLWLNLGDSYNSVPSWGRGGGGALEGGLPRYRPGAKWADGVVTQDSPRNGDGGSAPGLKSKDLVGIPWRVAFALQTDGWYLRSDIIWSKPNPMPESVNDRPTKAHEYLFLLSKSERYHYDADAIREPHIEPERSGKREHMWSPNVNSNEQLINGGFGRGKYTHRIYNPNGRNKRTVWEIATQPYPDAHFATFPPKLVEPCILAGCPEGGVVLDPFAGSGTVGEVAQTFGREAILIEVNPEYVELSKKRIEAVPLPMKMG